MVRGWREGDAALTVLQAEEARAAAAAMKKAEKSNTSNEIILLKSPE